MQGRPASPSSKLFWIDSEESKIMLTRACMATVLSSPEEDEVEPQEPKHQYYGKCAYPALQMAETAVGWTCSDKLGKILILL